MIRKVNALKVRQNLGQLLDEVYHKGDQSVIERAGRPMAAVVPVWGVAGAPRPFLQDGRRPPQHSEED